MPELGSDGSNNRSHIGRWQEIDNVTPSDTGSWFKLAITVAVRAIKPVAEWREVTGLFQPTRNCRINMQDRHYVGIAECSYLP